MFKLHRLLATGGLLLLIGCQPNQQKQQSEEFYDWGLPQGFPLPIVPADNPMTAAKVELGRQLFYDLNLSANGQQSCASCHIQSFAFSEPLKHSVGSTGEVSRRNSLALVNVAYNGTLTWAHPELKTIEQQLLIPIFGEAPVELGVAGNEIKVLRQLRTPEYARLFERAFPQEDVNFDIIIKALSSFTRSLISLNSPFDDYAYRAQDDAISESALRGLNLFFSERLECHHCHGGFNFTQSSSHDKQPVDMRPFHNNGLYNVDGKGAYPDSDTGLHEMTGEFRDMGRFRAPTLRNIEVTAPYMHDGSIATLEGVIELYNQGGHVIEEGNFAGDGRVSPRKSTFVKPLNLSEEEKQDLLEFLKSLTDQDFLTNPIHAEPK